MWKHLGLHQNFTSSFTLPALCISNICRLLTCSRHSGTGEAPMKVKISITLGLMALAISTVPSAFGQCGMPLKAVKPAAWHPLPNGAANTMWGKEDDRNQGEDGKSMVGMWHVVFTATASGPNSIPPTVIDNALAVWHSDHTEIMNSVRPPQDGNFCLGVWDQIDRSHYFLNHFPWYSNTFPNTNGSGIGDPQGPTQIREWITLDRDGDHFTGHFQLDAYDLSNTLAVSFTGTLTGTRVTTNTKESDLVSN